jgi:hypothetical protein
MNQYGGSEKFKYNMQLTTLIKEGLDTQGECYDLLDWLMLGQNFAKNQEEETAFAAFYIAHLMDHERIRTNSQLRFETNAMGSGPGITAASASKGQELPKP